MAGYATEIIVHQTEEEDVVGVSFTDRGENLFTQMVCAGEEGADALASACDLANSLEEATGVRWRLWDESMGLFMGVS